MSGGLFTGVGEASPAADGALADAVLWGLDDDAVAAIRSSLAAGGQAFDGVWPDNVAIVEAFLAAGTQWRTGLRPTRSGPRLVWIGLDYAAARAGIEALGLSITPELWVGLMVMESAAREALNEAEG